MAERTKFPSPLSNGPVKTETNGLYYPAKEDAAAEEISLHEILEILFKNKWLILLCFVVVLSVAAFNTLRQAPEYEASSTVFINSQQASPQLGDLMGLERFNRKIANEIEILRSRRIAMRVADQVVDIEKVPGTDRTLTVLAGGPVSKLAVAQRLQGRIRVDQMSRGVDIIQVTATSTIPEEAALIATLYAEEFVEYNRLASRSRMTASREFLGEITGRFEKELQSAEGELTAFLQSESVVAPDEEASQMLGQVSQLQQLQFQTQLDLGMKQAELSALEEQVDAIVPGLATQLASGDNLIVDRLAEQIANLEFEAEKKYARNPRLRDNPSADPVLVRTLDEIAQLRAQLNERSQRLVEDYLAAGNNPADGQGGFSAGTRLDGLSSLRQKITTKKVEVTGLQVRMDLLNGQVGQFRAQLSDIPRKDVILNRLERSLKSREQLYLALIEKLQEARIAEQSELGYVDIVDEAILPWAPVRPRVRRNLLFGAFLGLGLGIGLAFVRNAFDHKVRKPEDLRKRGYSVVGVISDMERAVKKDFKGKDRVVVDGREYSTRLIALLNPLSPLAEGYRRLRTNVQFSRPDAPTRVIMVTSPSPSEGKTVTALNLAVTMAQAGRRTLYLDADLRRPQGHDAMGLPREPGLVDLLFDTVPGDVEQFRTELDAYLYVVPAGRDIPNPAEVLGSMKMKKLLTRWKQDFDVIIVDTPPTLVIADALILASQCDATLLICSAGLTNMDAVDRSAEALKSVGADVIGVLLNRFDVKAAYGGYKYGYGYGYEYNYYYKNHYYGTKSTPRGRKKLARRT